MKNATVAVIAAAWALRVATPVAAEATPSHPRSARSAGTPSMDRVRRVLRWYERNEPSVDRVVRAALRARRISPDRARRAARRARNRGLLPTLRLGARHGREHDLSERQDTDGERTDNFSTDRDLTLNGSLSFDLGRLVFARHEISLLREGRALRREENELVTKVITLYFQRRRMQLERDLLEGQTLETELSIARTEALLDAFTNGAFTRMMGKGTRRTRR